MMNKNKKRLLSCFTIFIFVFNLMSNFIDHKVKAAGNVNLTVKKLVDKTTVFTGEEFTYTLQYSNPSTTDDANDVVLTDVLPANIKYVSNTPSLDVASVDINNINGHDVVAFHFKNPLKAGKSGIVKITVKFPEGTTLDKINGVSNVALNSATIDASNGNSVVSNEVSVTPLLKTPDWSITKNRIIPSGTLPAVDQPVTYEIKVNGNSTIGGLNLHDIRIVDTIPVGAEFVSASDGGTFASGKVTWTISTLNVGASLSRYVTIKYPKKVGSVGFDTSSTVTNVVDGYVKLLGSEDELTKQATASHGFTIASYGTGNFLKNGRQADDRYSVGQTANFYLSNIQNTGNSPLDNIVIEDNIPSEIKLTSITTGKYNNAVTLKVYYKTNSLNTWTPWPAGIFISPYNSTLNVAALSLPTDDYVTNVKWEITNGLNGIPSGFSDTNPISINGVVSKPAGGNTIINNAVLTANYGLPTAIVKNSSKTITVIDEMPWLVPTKTIKNGQTTYNMNDYVEYKLVIKNHDFATGDYHNPIGADIVPSELEDVTFTGWDKGNSDISLAPVTDDTRNVGGKKLLTWEFTGNLKPGQYVEVYYKAKIKDKTLAGKTTNDFYISSNIGSVYENPVGEQLADVNDLDNDGSTSDKFIKASNDIFVKFIGSIDAQKWVKGELDTDWNYYGTNPGYGLTLPGGIVDYRLKVKNDGANGPISNIVLIDILPYEGDKGIIDTSDRASEWRPYLVNKITGPNGIALDPNIKIYYTTNPNPSKIELEDPINKHAQSGGADGWSLTPPDDITSVRALKFDFTNISLAPNEEKIVEWPMRAPYGAPTDEIAWNSFGYSASYPDVNGQQAFLPSEPKKVGFQVQSQPNATYNLGNFVWEDMNKNGIQDDGETGIDGVLVKLYNYGDTTPMKYTRTGLSHEGKSGYYEFPNLPAGHYQVEFVYPSNYKVSPFNQGSDDALDSNGIGIIGSFDDNGTTKNSIKTEDITLNSDDMSIDLGLYKIASLGDYVWNDENTNGVQDSGENPIDGVTVKLLDESGNQAKDDDGNLVPDQITGANGNATGKYIFSNLSPGVKYMVQFINPNRYYKFSSKGSGTTTDSDGTTSGDGTTTLGDTSATTSIIQLKSGEDRTDIDQGMYLAQLGDFVWHDLNGNGKQGESGETGINGVTVTLIDKATGLRAKDAYGVDIVDAITGANSIGTGKYLFKNLKPGTYQVKFTKPVGYDKFSPQDAATDLLDSDADRTTGITGDVVITAGDRNTSVDAGFYKLASIGDKVWNDKNGNGIQDTGTYAEPGIAGITVNLYKSDGTPSGTTLTDVNGNYTFGGLDPADYYVEFVNPGQYVFTAKDVSSNSKDTIDSDADVITGKTATTNLTSGENDTSWDAGLHKGYIGNYVWEDKDANGKQDDGNTGINGVVVNLYGSDGTTLVGTFTTKNGPDGKPGYYEFTDLDPGSYIVKVVKPSGYVITNVNQGTDDKLDSNIDSLGVTAAITLAKGQIEDTIDAGMWKPASIGDQLWEDKNGNGIQESGEPGINGATVYLYKQGNPLPIKSMITAYNGVNDGYYLFDNLTPGSYSIKFDIPVGYDSFTAANKGGNAALDSDVDKYGVTAFTTLISDEKDTIWDAGVYKYVSIGDRVWRDTNMNGIQESGEPGMSGVTVNLYMYNGSTYISKAFTTTDGSGNYLFDKLDPGQYIVEFIKPTGYAITKVDQGSDNGIDSDASVSDGKTTVITLTSGQNDLTWDAGLYKLASVGDFVWDDKNGNGIQDAGETGVSGVLVQLYDKNNNLKGTTTTDVSGKYSFVDIVPGDYYVKFTLPNHYAVTDKDQGSDNGKDSDVDTSTFKTTMFTLSEGQDDLSWDMGIYKLSSIGDYIFEDMNADGIQDSSDKALPNFTVRLLDSSGNVIKTTTTDSNGKYLFDDLQKGDYYVQFVKDIYTFSPKAAGNDINKDSNADATGKTDKITLGVDEHLTDIDAGLYKPASIGDYVWLDKNNDGKQDGSEPGISGITVNLLDKDGKVITTTTTDSNGKYSFTNLVPGDYYLEFVSNKDYYKHTDANMGDATKDSNADKTSGKTDKITLKSGDNNLTVDAGFTVKTGITIEKTVYAGHDGGKETGSELVIGEKGTLVTYLFKVTNTGDTYLNNVEINDSTLGIVKSNMNLISGTEPLAPGATLLYYYETTINGDLTNTAKTTGTPSDDKGITVPNIDKPTAEDTAKVDEVKPGIDVQKTIYFGKYSSGTNGDETASGKNGEWVTYIFTVTNTGDTYLNNLEINDLTLGINKSNMTKISGTEPLAPGAKIQYYYEVKINGDLTNTVKVIGTPSDSDGNDLPNTKKPEDEDTANAKALGSIGDYLWYDNNGDGVQDANEPALVGVKLNLLDKDGKVVGTATTDSTGKYIFDRLVPAEYTVVVDTTTLPEGLKQTYELDGTEGGNVKVTLAPGQIVDTVDFGYYKLGKLGDYVWEDSNGDGIQDSGEKGIANVTVKLYKADGTPAGATTTDSNGLYKFDSLQLGKYYVVFEKVVGFEYTKENGSVNLATDSNADLSGKTAEITVVAGTDDMSWDAGMYRPGSIGDYLWYDNNGDGVQDANEPALVGVKLNLLDKDGNIVGTTTTDSTGKYIFDRLVPADYTVVVDTTTLPEGLKQTYELDGTVGGNVNVTVKSGDKIDTVDFGYYKLGKLGNYVWEDINGDGIQNGEEKGIKDVTVNLYKADGTLVDTIKTDENGLYKFDNLVLGNYYIEFVKPTGYEITKINATEDKNVDSDAASDGRTINIKVIAGTDDMTWDVGLYKPASIGDYVWLDKNNDGKQDGTEPGISGITVNLLDKDGKVIATTTTDNNGKYSFINLVPADYYVEFVANKDYYKHTDANSGDETKDSDADKTSGKTDKITLKSGDNNLTVDAGFTVKTGITIEKTVYAGHDGGKGTGSELVIGEKGTLVTYLFKITNTGDTYLNNVEINDSTLGIVKSNMNLISGTEPLAPGATLIYYYETTINGDLTNTAKTTGTPSDDKGTVVPNIEKPAAEDTAKVDEVKPGIDVQKTIYFGKYSIGNNGDETASGKNGEWVTYIFTVTNTGDTYLNNVEINDLTLGINKSSMTKISGTEPLAPGAKIQYYYETKINGDLTNTVKVTGTASDSDGNDLPNVKKPEAEDTANAKALGSIGDYLWYDNNGDGVQDANEPALVGVKLNLLDKDGNIVGTTTTDSTGKYIFDRLVPADYTVVVDTTTLPEGLKQTYELDGTVGGNVKVTLAPGQIIDTVDFGYYKLGKLGNYVWEDSNADGIQNIGEKCIANVTVKLYKADGTLVGETTTNSDGLYKFDGLTLGQYYIEFVKPEVAVFTKVNSLEDKNLDSDARTSGRTASITVVAGTNDMTWDAGVYIPAKIGDYVWEDKNLNGIQGVEEKAIKEVTVNLYDGYGNLVKTTKTDDNGKYEFNSLVPGEYQVEFIVPTNYKITVQNQGSDISKDSNPEVLTGRSTKLIVKSGDNNQTIDAGLYKVTDINGKVDDGKTGNPIDGATVTVTDKDGKVVDKTTTDKNGEYKINDIPSGNEYTITIKKDGYIDKEFQINIPDEPVPLGTAIFPAKVLPKTGLPYYNFILTSAIACTVFGTILVLGSRKKENE